MLFYRPGEDHGLPGDPFNSLVTPRPIWNVNTPSRCACQVKTAMTTRWSSVGLWECTLTKQPSRMAASISCNWRPLADYGGLEYVAVRETFSMDRPSWPE